MFALSALQWLQQRVAGMAAAFAVRACGLLPANMLPA